ncbi:MAG: carboxypeptidase M32 [Pirellulales bacterium]
MNDSTQSAYEALCQHLRQTAVLESIDHLLGWDERTLMPVAAAEHRADQMTLLAGLIHQRNTDPQIGHWIDVLIDSPLAEEEHSDAGTVIRQIKRQFEKLSKLPQSLVEQLARTAVEGQQIWQKARAEDDYAAFAPIMKKTIELKRQQADAVGFPECRYDALLDDFEPQERTSNVRRVLAGLRDELVPLICQIADSGRSPDIGLLRRHYPAAVQEKFGQQAARRIGFSFDRGRLDETVHPFCSGLGPNDTRITTRYEEQFFPSAFFGILHEAGHGIYDQGLRSEWYGLPPGKDVSLGIHESQSRMWENQVGRSRAFWEYNFPHAQAAFPAALADVSLDDFYFAMNDVRPSLIRVEADEATYNLHILIRFELEQALMEDQLTVEDLPDAWNQKYEDYLGARPTNDADGVLQDIHWSGGAIGYFPTYSLGNLYAAQLFATAHRDLGDLDQQFASGQFDSLREWLQQNIHRRGQCYPAAELVELVTGEPLNHKFLIDQLRAKLSPLYGLS